MEKLPEKIDSKFRFVLLAAERAERMMRGAKPKVDIDNKKASRIVQIARISRSPRRESQSLF